MTGYEFTLRCALLAVGFILMLTGAGLAWRTQREVTPITLIVLGFLCLVAATDGAE